MPWTGIFSLSAVTKKKMETGSQKAVWGRGYMKIAYKAFRPDLSCQAGGSTYQYQLQKWNEIKEAKCRETGFHCAEDPLDCLSYYPVWEQESYIVFLRRTKAMEQPYYTLEIEPDGTTRQKRTVGDNQNNDYHRAEKFLKKWQAAIRPRLSQEDFERQEISRQLRMYELESLRNDKVTVHGGIHAGELLADILEADLMEA